MSFFPVTLLGCKIVLMIWKFFIIEKICPFFATLRVVKHQELYERFHNYTSDVLLPRVLLGYYNQNPFQNHD
jgi:hypothetical protein